MEMHLIERIRLEPGQRHYRAVFRHYAIVEPDNDNIPPILGYSKARARSELTHDFPAKDDDEAIRMAKDYAEQFYRKKKKDLPSGSKKLANRPTLDRILEIRHPRRVKLK